MKINKLAAFVFILSVFVFIGCKTETKSTDDTKTITSLASAETVSLNISGMTCELGCAKTIESKLAKKEGVLDAKVVFKDSIATIKFDGNKTNTPDLIAFVDCIADYTYKAKKVCAKACAKNCCKTSEKKACSGDCKKDCCMAKLDEKKACAEGCKKDCCTV